MTLDKGELVGEFKDGQAHGYGQYTNQDETYEGQYVRDEMDGVGRKKTADYEYVG